MTPQLSLFVPQFDSRIRSVEIDGKTYFSVLDVFQYYGSKGSADNPRQYWANSKKRLEKQGADVVTGLIHRSVEGGGRPTPYATFQVFLRIAQTSEIREWESIRSWMADVAHERIEETLNPELGEQRAKERTRKAYLAQGKDAQWIATRERSIDVRHAFTDALRDAVKDIQPMHYGMATNDVSRGLWGRDVKQLRAEMGISDKQTPRDFQTSIAQSYTTIVEEMIAHYLRQSDLDWSTAHKLIVQCAELIGVSAQQVSGKMGVDLATGKPLIGSAS